MKKNHTEELRLEVKKMALQSAPPRPALRRLCAVQAFDRIAVARVQVLAFLEAEARNYALLGVNAADALHRAPAVLELVEQAECVSDFDRQLIRQCRAVGADDGDKARVASCSRRRGAAGMPMAPNRLRRRRRGQRGHWALE